MPHVSRLGKDYSQRAGSTLRSAILICIGSSMDARPASAVQRLQASTRGSSTKLTLVIDPPLITARLRDTLTAWVLNAASPPPSHLCNKPSYHA